MLEIAFGESAVGGLKLAQQYGMGPYREGAISVLVMNSDEAKPTRAEIKEIRRKAREREKQLWEKAVPMGGSPADVFGFRLALSVGPIAEDLFAQNRMETLNRLFGSYPDEGREATATLMAGFQKTLQTVLSRAANGEPLRIWYSESPDDLCGLYWLSEQLVRQGNTEQVFLIKLPELEVQEDGCVVTYLDWGEMEPGGFGRFLSQARRSAPEELRYYAARWKALQEENSPLRASINGQLFSVPEDFYDSFIRRELKKQPEEFDEAVLIGRILGKYRLGIGDGWLALRIEQMIRNGELDILTQPGPHEPTYRRRLRKKQ